MTAVSTIAAPAADIPRMHCMEVWGGNQPANSGVSMLGLDAWLFSEPYLDSEAGGDVHYVSSCATGRVTRVLVADVSGHGDTVSTVAAALRRLMRRHVNFIDQARFVREMNREFTALSKDGRFATALVTTFFAPRNRLSLCNAGHPAPLWYRAADQTWSVLRQPARSGAGLANVPWGITDDVNYEQITMQLGLGDLLVMYTDSLIESRAADGRLLGEEGLLSVVRAVDPNSPAEFIPSLLKKIAALHEGNLKGDDVTVLVLRPNGVSPRVPFRNRLLAPFRVLGGLVRSLKPGAEPAPWPELTLPNLGGAFWHRLNRSSSRSNR